AQPIPHFSFARDDSIRSLFRFAHGERIGECGIYWLKVSAANCYGGEAVRPGDRVATFDERAAWVDKNMDRIRALVEDPGRELRSWGDDPWRIKGARGGHVPNPPEYVAATSIQDTKRSSGASDPFQFLSHAMALAKCDNKPDFETTLPLPFDASNSGAQYCSLLKRDRLGAALTNLTFDGKINDLYQTVCDRVQERLEATGIIESAAGRRARWCLSKGKALVARKPIKRLVVAYLYGQTTRGGSEKISGMLRQEASERVLKSTDSETLPIPDIDHFEDAIGTELDWEWPKKITFPQGYCAWFVRIVHEEIAA